jgi:hypothetical protein
MSEMPDGWRYSRLRTEIYCPHGTGHPAPWSSKETHGCDGCCGGSPPEEHDEWEQAVEAARDE